MREVTWRAPGRVNLIGEHTDYNAGLALPFAIGRSVTVTATARQDGVLELRSGQAPGQVMIALEELEPGAVAGWAAYPAGVAWALAGWADEAGRAGKAGRAGEAGRAGLVGATLVVGSDLPQGAGLASSAALECAVAGCLADLAGLVLSRSELAALAWRAENDFVGMPCGIMDQSAVMLCRAGHALLLDCRSGQTADVPLDEPWLRVLVIDTGVRHELTGGEYAARRRECEAAASLLGVPSLREVPETDLAGLADSPIARRARHVVTENGRVRRAVELLRGEGGLLVGSPVGPRLGSLLTQSHHSLRDDFEVSWPEADLAVDAAIAAGAFGARMTGAGFGGCVLALVPADGAADAIAAVRSAFASAGLPSPAVIDAVPAPGARRTRAAG